MPTASLKMKELETTTGFGREAIRFYIKEGLLPEPDKPKRNVAHYSDEHVLRLKLIKRLQVERSMPLSQIKRVLKNADLSSFAAQSDLAAFEIAFMSMLNGNTPHKELSLSDVVKQTGFSSATLQEMDELSIITIINVGKNKLLNFHDVAVLEKWGKIKALGFEDKEGFDLQFLKRYVEATRKLAEVEVQQFLNVYARQAPEAGAAMGIKGVELANDLLGILHMRAVSEEVSTQVKG